MSPWAEIALVVRRELWRNFRSAKGALLAALSVLGGAGAATVLARIDRFRRENLPPGTDLRDLQEPFFTNLYGPAAGKALADCPYSLWLMLVATLWLAPLLVALMTFDAVSGDAQYRTVRYWVVRTRRSSYIVGKFLGAWLTVLAVSLGMNLVGWGATAASGHMSIGYVATWGARFFAVAIPITGAWCGIAIVAGSPFKSPFMSLLVILFTFFALWFLNMVSVVGRSPVLAYAYPNGYDSWLLSSDATRVGQGLFGVAVVGAVAVVAAVLAFERRDL